MPTDNVYRVKGKSPLGTSTMVALRTLDVFLQYGIIAHGLADPLLALLGVNNVVSDAPAVALGLPLKSLLVLAMAAGSALKHDYWAVFVAKEQMPVGTAVLVSLFNTVFNSLNSIFALTAAASYFAPSFLTQSSNVHEISPSFAIGVSAYSAGILVETISEVQRRNFKDDRKNAGKPFKGGLFSLARHINYGGYTTWRTGYALASGGWLWATFVASFFSYDFLARGIPVLDEYCTKRYGASWAAYKQKVRYVLIPGII